MNLKKIKDVMKNYGKAWEDQNTELLLECLTKTGSYQESPLAKSYRGHKEIKRFWEVTVGKNTKNTKFKLGRCYMSDDKKTGFAEWECKNNHRWEHDGKWRKGHMVGIMVLKIKGDKITSLNEYWNTKVN